MSDLAFSITPWQCAYPSYMHYGNDIKWNENARRDPGGTSLKPELQCSLTCYKLRDQ